jgi:hypothetical protein
MHIGIDDTGRGSGYCMQASDVRRLYQLQPAPPVEVRHVMTVRGERDGLLIHGVLLA